MVPCADGCGLESAGDEPFRSGLGKRRNPPSAVAVAGVGKDQIRLETYVVLWAGLEHPKTLLEKMGQNLSSEKDPLSP